MGISPLADWSNFYVISGSSAGALIGLTFVISGFHDSIVHRHP